MFGPYFTFPINPPKPPRAGTQWRRKGETLGWIILEVEADRVVLEGPGSCTGKMYLDLSEFYKQFERV